MTPLMRDQLVAEAATYTTHNKHKRRTSVSSARFEPAIPAVERHIYSLLLSIGPRMYCSHIGLDVPDLTASLLL